MISYYVSALERVSQYKYHYDNDDGIDGIDHVDDVEGYRIKHTPEYIHTFQLKKLKLARLTEDYDNEVGALIDLAKYQYHTLADDDYTTTTSTQTQTQTQTLEYFTAAKELLHCEYHKRNERVRDDLGVLCDCMLLDRCWPRSPSVNQERFHKKKTNGLGDYLLSRARLEEERAIAIYTIAMNKYKYKYKYKTTCRKENNSNS
eukprot:420618_1